MPLDHFALDLQAFHRQFHQRVQTLQQASGIALEHIPQARAVDGDHPQRTSLFRRTEQAATALEQLAHIQLQTAAHRAHLVGLHVGVEEVLEVRQAVARSHFKQAVGVFAVPWEVMGDVVGRDREGEHSPFGVARLHHFDVGAVEQVHFHLQVAVGKRHFLAADHRDLLFEVLRAHPVERQVGERCLGAPARRHVEVVDELLDRLAHLVETQLVLAHVRRQVSVEGAERLGAGPFVLQGAEEVDHLAQGAAQVLRRAGFHPARYAVEAFVQQGSQRPASTVAGEHVEVVHMQVSLPVRLADGFAVDLVQPVVGGDLARHVQYQPAQGITLVGVGLYSPVFTVEVFVHRGRDFDHGSAVASQTPMLFAVDDVGTHREEVAGVHQNPFDPVLDLLDMQPRHALQPGKHRLEQAFDFDVRVLTGRLAGGDQCLTNLVGIEGNQVAIALVQAVTSH
ncbi:hypothetical protein D3C73_894130 [compost metagenome]